VEKSSVDNRPPKPETLRQRGDFGEFTRVMKRLVTVPYSEIQARLTQERLEKKQKREKTSVRVSRVRG
jgi:hypothetical protein